MRGRERDRERDRETEVAAQTETEIAAETEDSENAVRWHFDLRVHAYSNDFFGLGVTDSTGSGVSEARCARALHQSTRRARRRRRRRRR